MDGASSTEVVRIHRSPDGSVRFVGAPPGAGFSAARPFEDAETSARIFLSDHGPAFGIVSDRTDLVTRSARYDERRASVRFDQLYDGFPVFGAQALVQVGENGVQAAVLDLLRSTVSLDNPPSPLLSDVPMEAAEQTARWIVASDHPGTELTLREEPQLVIFAPEVLDMKGLPRLAWLVDVGAPQGLPIERLLIDAQKGTVLLRYPLAHTALNRRVFDAQYSSTVPADPARAEGDPVVGDSEIDNAYDFAGDTYSFWLDEHGRDSIDDAGHPLEAVVRFCPSGNCSTDDAFWNGVRSFYTQGMATDDIVAHEFTHGLTMYTSGLVYVNQSGAINESMSDIWGEFVDQTNGAGNDSSIAKWLIGEDSAINAFRSMKDPPFFGDPDSTCHSNYATGMGDNGGVHINSGVLNKLAYLLVEGGSFNGYAISGMGIPAVADLFYECQTNLLVPGSSFEDVYHAMGQAAINLGLEAAQRTNLDNAMRAVHIDPYSNCQPPPPLPTNDTCENALPIIYGDIIGHSDGATLSDAPSCVSFEASDVWYAFSATADETVIFSTCDYAKFDTAISVFEGCGGSKLGCNDDACGTRSRLSIPVTAGTDYYVRISGYGGQFGPFVLNVSRDETGTVDAYCRVGLIEAFAADFETDLGGMTTSGLWHRTNACRTQNPEHPSDHALFFGVDDTCNYDSGGAAQGHATSPAIDLTSAEGEITLSFDDLLVWSGSGETADVQISTDDGANWTTLISTATSPFFFPNSDWGCEAIDISDYAGETALIRFGFDTGASTNFELPGLYVDNLVVEAEGFRGAGAEVPCGRDGRLFYVADFEADDEGYGMSGLWHRSSACAATRPSHHSDYGLYFGIDATCSYDTGEIEIGEATSPPIDLTDASGLVLLSLGYHLGTVDRKGFDEVEIEISDDGGKTWWGLASNRHAPELADGGGVWKCGTYNISAYAGRTVQIRMTFDTVYSFFNNYEGFFVDDIRIVGVEPTSIFADGFESGDMTFWSSF